MTSTARETRSAKSGATAPGGPGPAARHHLTRWTTMARAHRADLLIGLAYLVLAGWLTHGLWPDPGHRVLALNPADQTLYEWFLATDARVLFGDFSLLSDRLNAPAGVNLMTNTTVIALGILFSPVTLLFGAATTFALLAALNLAGTAIAWYLLFRRVLGAGRLAAVLGGGLCGFAPGMVSQTNSHLHMTAQWLVPVMVWLLVRMVRAADPGSATGTGSTADPGSTTGTGSTVTANGSGGRDWRRIGTSAAGLAAAIAAQVFVGEEVLFLAAVALVIFTVAYAAARPRLTVRVLPGFLAGMVGATVLATLVLAWPLWFQFRGPQGVHDGMFSPHYFSADLATWVTLSPLSIGGSEAAAQLTTGPAEYNTFLGWPLLIAAALAAGWLIRRPLVIGCVAAGLVMAALSMGPDVIVARDRTTVAGPYRMLMELPVVDGALPMRFALAVVPLLATVLVLAVDRARTVGWAPARWLVPTGAALALLPAFPAPLPTADRPPVPEFFAAGHWRDCVRTTGVLVPVPLATPNDPWPMRWAAATDVGFAMPEGFFIGPYGDNRGASMGTYKQPTSKLLADVARTGAVPPIGMKQRQEARHDIAFWNASCFVLADDAPHREELRTAMEGLLGPGTRVADVWTWKVR
ncbi:hypothetical protein [Plantactinospora sp. GCM10030261]|uniref:hypothetical protein n=1 Tax=Plantactinospora sp. GCM10030261 TaxID=3273420 RepID=UPI0036228442